MRASLLSSARGIRAGRAFVELFADDSKLVRGLRRAQKKLKAFGQSIRNMGLKIEDLDGLSPERQFKSVEIRDTTANTKYPVASAQEAPRCAGRSGQKTMRRRPGKDTGASIARADATEGDARHLDQLSWITKPPCPRRTTCGLTTTGRRPGLGLTRTILGVRQTGAGLAPARGIRRPRCGGPGRRNLSRTSSRSRR